MALSVQLDPRSRYYAIVYRQTEQSFLQSFKRLSYSAFYDDHIRGWGFKNARKVNDIVRKHNGFPKGFGGPSWGCPHQWEWFFDTREDAETAVEQIEALIMANKLSYRPVKEAV